MLRSACSVRVRGVARPVAGSVADPELSVLRLNEQLLNGARDEVDALADLEPSCPQCPHPSEVQVVLRKSRRILCRNLAVMDSMGWQLMVV